MRVAALLVVSAALGLTGCGGPSSSSADRPAPAEPVAAAQPATNRDVRPDLPSLMRTLVPTSERASLTADELKVNECGISPTFPCMNAFFSVAKGKPFAFRLHRLRALAVSNGWRVERVRREQNGSYLELVRGDVHARYTLPRLGSVADSIVEVSVAGPLTVLPAPSAADKASWSLEKRQYVKAANLVCAHEFARLGNPKKFARVLRKASRSLATLPPPDGERQEVATFLRPLRSMAQAAQAADRAEGEDALPAVVAIGQYATRFNKATTRYGLDKCVLR